MMFQTDEWLQCLFGQIITTFAVILLISSTIVPQLNQYLSLRKPIRVLLTILICGVIIQANLRLYYGKSEENIFSFVRLSRSELNSSGAVVDKINSIEDAYINNPEKLSYIEEINKAFVNEATKYYVKIYVLYGDVIDITSYKAKQEVLKQAKYNTTVCLHLVFLYGFLVFMPKNTNKMLKLSTMLIFAISFGIDLVLYNLLENDFDEIKNQVQLHVSNLHKNLAQWSPLSSCFTIYEISELTKRIAMLVGFCIICLCNVLYETNVRIVQKKFEFIQKYCVSDDKIFKAIENIDKDQKEKVKANNTTKETSVKYIKVIIGMMTVMGILGLIGMYSQYYEMLERMNEDSDIKV